MQLTPDSLSETDRCIATRQNKMAAPDVVSARFKKLNVCFFFLFFFFFVVVVFVLGRNALCRNDHRTQNQSLNQALLAFFFFLRNSQLENRDIFGRHFRKRSHQSDRCIARTNRYRALPEIAFLMQLTSGLSLQSLKSRPMP